MPLLAQDLTFFFGAGASAAFGIPTMRKMTADFENELRVNGSENERNLYYEIIRLLRKDLRSNMDIEAIFSVIDGLKDLKEHRPEHIGELALYVSRKLFGNTLMNNKVIPKEAQMKTINLLESRFQSFIRRSCRLRGEYTDTRRNVLKHFFNSISEILTETNARSEDLQVKYSTDWTLFTTNYDRCLEVFWREDMRGPKLYTGFEQDKLLADAFLHAAANKVLPPHGGLRLVKLHGSTSWLRRKDTGEIVEKEYDMDQASNGIYPLSQKQLYIDPYVQMFYCLNKELEGRKVCIVIGYSFRDPVIQNIFASNFDKDENKKMILVHPEASDIVKSRFPSHKKRILQINKKFGRNDYEQVNYEVAKQLKSLR